MVIQDTRLVSVTNDKSYIAYQASVVLDKYTTSPASLKYETRLVPAPGSAGCRQIGPLHDPVTWYKITHARTQVAQWDF